MCGFVFVSVCVSVCVSDLNIFSWCGSVFVVGCARKCLCLLCLRVQLRVLVFVCLYVCLSRVFGTGIHEL